MNIFNKVTLQSMKKSRTRTIVTVIGVILSASMITAVTTFAVSLLNYMVNGSIMKYGGWHIGFLDVDSSFVQERSLDDNITDITVFENVGYAALDGGKNPDKPYLFIAGFSQEAFDTLPINLLSGRLPDNSGEILVSAHVEANGGIRYQVGQTLSLDVGSRMAGNESLGQHTAYAAAEEILVPNTRKTYTVVGIFQRPVFEEMSAPGYTLITTQEPADNRDNYSIFVTRDNYSVFVTLTNPRQVHEFADSTAGTHGYILNDNVLRFLGLSKDTLFNALLYTIGGILAALIMIGSILLIYNSFNISLNERMRQFGILSSVGATAKQLRGSVLFEGLCIGAAGIPFGIIVGISSIRLIIFFVAANFGNILYDAVPLTMTVSVPAILAAAAVSLVTILISAYIPARKAAGTPVMESIRQTNEVKITSKDVKTSKLTQRIYGLEGTLALKNFKRNRKRYGSIVLSLTFSLVLFVSASTFGNHLKQAAEQIVTAVDYDICFSTRDMDESDVFRLFEDLKKADGVYNSSYQAIIEYSCGVRAGDFSDRYLAYAGYASPDETDQLIMAIQFIPDSEYLRFIEGLGLPAEEYTGENAKMTAVAKANLSNEETGQKELFDMFANRSMTFSVTPHTNGEPIAMQEQNIDITFVDTIPLDTHPRQSSAPKSTVFMIVAPYQQLERFKIPGEHLELGLTFLSENPTQSAVQMEKMIQDAGITSVYNLYNVYQIMEENRNILFIVDVFTYVFVIMISLIATANVFNTISTNIRQRRRELAMLRSVGMSERAFKRMMNFECAFYGMRTLLFGLPIAAVLSWLIYKGLIIAGAEVGFAFPWASMGISVCSVFLIVFITMLYATHKIKKENIIDALRDDMS